MRRLSQVLAGGSLLSLAIGCSSQQGGSTGPVGGAATGGSAPTGGASATGGIAPVAGAPSNGGAPVTGSAGSAADAPALGGSPGSSGASTSGGGSSSGGSAGNVTGGGTAAGGEAGGAAGGPGSTAPGRIEAECAHGSTLGDCNSAATGSFSGTELENADTTVGYFDAGDFLVFRALDLSAFNALTLRFANQGADGSVELRLDSASGQLIGTLTPVDTGSWTTWQQATIAIDPTTGVHDLYLVGAGADGIANLDWIELGVCTPDCSGRECGGDGCGGVCGTCPAGASCSAAAQCVDGPIPGAISPLLVGNNVWYNPNAEVWNAVAGAGLRIIRVGGISYDNDMPSNAQLSTWVNNIKAIGAEPLIQVSQYDGPEAAAAIVTYFNVTTGNPVKYWNIGNEPWLERDRPSTGTMGAIVAGYVKPIASAMKAVDPSIKIYAPDECYYMKELYDSILGGDHDIAGRDANGNYYIDGISWHRYAEPGALASDLIGNIQAARARVDYANNLHGRTGAAALGFGIGEFNSNAGGGGPCTFANGQAVGRAYGAMMKYGGTYASLWSMKEGGSSCGGTDFGFLNGDNSPRPSYYHMQMVSRNFSGVYADGESNLGTLHAFGAVDTDRIVVMLINTGGAQTCSVRLNGDTTTGGCQVNIDAGAAVTHTQAIGATTSMLLVFDRQGQATRRITYAEGGAPVEVAINP